eukprot:4420368-Pleurochrysis_carterae.AAC.1
MSARLTSPRRVLVALCSATMRAMNPFAILLHVPISTLCLPDFPITFSFSTKDSTLQMHRIFCLFASLVESFRPWTRVEASESHPVGFELLPIADSFLRSVPTRFSDLCRRRDPCYWTLLQGALPPAPRPRYAQMPACTNASRSDKLCVPHCSKWLGR